MDNETLKALSPHAADYNVGAWDQYEIWEIGMWVHLLAKRAAHRSNPQKKAKDLYDAENYLQMMREKLLAAASPGGDAREGER